ncbi:glycerate kinase [Brevibacillus reuszeri]|uniref:Glycerate kinase n=1 Tax=Brevibacillus reuszeri TaxID=54915 RepID=A0A0K9YX63_9BACL|nr:glycerate kinase [Brevibacillus reuszeri]KNB73227.1 glycerate kinase [Brevibacillus reuszeri]MED1856833.1 glycerate kinase [Brevibacillus reuszeri]GED68417.1 glycerate kinase [Brevibacillus reuszeri]
MKIIIAPDSFKGSLSAPEAAGAIEAGIKKVLPQAQTVLVPVADGGEGTMESLVASTDGRKVEVDVTGPMNVPVRAAYGILGDQVTCVIEMASASGLILVQPEERNPLISTTYGTGELIKRALDDGCRRFIVGIGGSATNDGGIGMLQALGMKLLDAEGNSIGFGGGELHRIREIDDQHFDPRISESHFLLASDVQNPLIGPNGASHVFGPQKGATVEMVKALDHSLGMWADLVEAKTGISLHNLPGAGAAGGIGGAFQAFFPSRMERGIDIVIEYTGLGEKMQDAAIVFTGEGQIDFQTASGKTPMGVAQEAQKWGVPVFVLAGSVGSGTDILYGYGIHSINSIMSGPMTLQEAMSRAPELLAQKAEQVLRTYLAGLHSK